MPLESIRKRILADSEAKAEEVRGEADAEARRILAEARGRAKEIEKRAEAEAEAESKRIERETQAGLEIEANAILLDARGAAVAKAMQGVTKEIKRMIDKEYLPSMLKSGAKQFRSASDEPFVVVTSKKNAKVVEQLKLNPKYQDVEGFVLQSSDGRMRLLVSSDSAVENNLDEIRRELSGLLFSKAERKAEKPGRTQKKTAGRRKTNKRKR